MARLRASLAAAHELLPACRILFRDGAEHSRDRLLAAREPAGLFVARDSGGKLRAAALVQVLPGAMGVAWPPRGDSRDAEDAATLAACAWLRGRGVKVCQAFAPPGGDAEVAPLERCGFRHTTQLALLQSDLSAAREPSRLSFTAHGAAPPADFAAALLATHEGTLDCPELNAPRTPEELLAGFTASGAAEWHLASLDREPVGVVLMEFVADFEAAELTYLGVVPAFRGRGLGAELLRFALREAAGARLRELKVSVDTRNEPAMRLYAAHGFAEYDRREVWLASWPT
jgi:ribosomal protein S18 acetylase RimI-like enzyme